MYQNMHQPEFWVFGAEKIQNRSAPKFRADLLQKCEKTRENGEKQRKTEIVRSPFFGLSDWT